MNTLVKLMVLGCGLMTLTSLPAFSDEPLPPPLPPQHGAGGNGGPAGAPIDGGLGILLGIGAAYGGKKYLQSKKLKKEAAVVTENEPAEAGFTNCNAS